MRISRRSFLKALGLAPALPIVAKVAPLIAAPAAAPAAALVGWDVWEIPADLQELIKQAEEMVMNQVGIDRAGNLYFGGQFITAGGADVERIARWTGADWAAE